MATESWQHKSGLDPCGYRPASRDRVGREPSGQAVGQRGHRASLGWAPGAGDSGSSSWCSVTVGSVARMEGLPRPWTARVIVTSVTLSLSPSTRLTPNSLRLTRPRVHRGQPALSGLGAARTLADAVPLRWLGSTLPEADVVLAEPSEAVTQSVVASRPNSTVASLIGDGCELCCSSQEWMCRIRVRLLRCTSPIRARMSSSALMVFRM